MRDIIDYKRVINAARYSANGFGHLLRHEAAFRQEVALFAILLVLGWVLDFSFGDQCLQVTLMCFVLVTEALNTAIENIVDRISVERHQLSGTIKDIGSAAVVIAFVPLLLFWVYAIASIALA